MAAGFWLCITFRKLTWRDLESCSDGATPAAPARRVGLAIDIDAPGHHVATFQRLHDLAGGIAYVFGDHRAQRGRGVGDFYDFRCPADGIKNGESHSVVPRLLGIGHSPWDRQPNSFRHPQVRRGHPAPACHSGFDATRPC